MGRRLVAHLAGPSLLALLSPADRDWLVGEGCRRSYPDGAVVHERGDPDANMVVVISGGIRLARLRAGGHEGMMSAVRPGQHFADVLMFGNRVRTHRATAQGDTVLDLYDHAAFDRLLDRPAIVRALYRITAERLLGALTMLDDVRSLSREAHLAKVLLHLNKAAPGGSIACVQEDLAGLLGVSIMTVAKSLRLLREKGLIETGYRRVRVLDPPRLRSWLSAQE